MIVNIQTHFIEVERGGWLCADPTGTYTVTRVDGSKRDVTRVELIDLLKSEPVVMPDGACPKCGEVGLEFQQAEPDGNNHLCPTCGPYRVEPSDSED